MTIIVRCSTTENEMQEIFSYQWCRIQGPPSKVADCMTKNIKEAVQRGTGYSVKCSKCTSCNTSKPLYLNHLNFACVVTSTTASATPNRHLSMLKKKKRSLSDSDSEINEEVRACDREEIMKWCGRMMNRGHSRRSQVYSCVAGKDKARRDDEWWQETDDKAMKGEKWQVGRRGENKTSRGLLLWGSFYVKFNVISRMGARATEIHPIATNWDPLGFWFSCLLNGRFK